MNDKLARFRESLGPNPWRGIRPGELPYVLGEDRAAIERFNRVARPECRIQLDVLPEPFVGHPLAPIVILSLNPGYKEYQIEAHGHPRVSGLIQRTLLLEGADDAIPFHHLHPDYRAQSSSTWWPRCLKGWIDRYGLEATARSFFCIEFFPYASRRYQAMRSFLPSQRFGFELARKRIEAGATVIAFRKRKEWEKVLRGVDSSQWIRVVNPQAGSLNPPSATRKGNLRAEDAERLAAAIEAGS